MTMTENSEATETTRRTVLAALGGAAATVAGAGSASAQEANETAPTDTPDGPEIAVELGPVVKVRTWEYTDGSFVLELEADYPTSIKITDTGAVMRAMTEGSGATATKIPTRGYSLGSDTTRVTFEPAPPSHRAPPCQNSPFRNDCGSRTATSPPAPVSPPARR